MKTIILFPLFLTLISAAPKPQGHCTSDEQTIFTCKLKKQKELSVCYKDKKLEYRFGKSKSVELTLPKRPEDKVTWNTVMYSGGGGAYVRFENENVSYVVFSKILKGGDESAGVIVFKDKKKAAELICENEGIVNSNALEKSGVAKEIDGTDPLIAE